MRTLSLFPLLLLFVMCQHIQAQQKSKVKFGKITPEDFKQQVYAVDSNAAAVIIADIGSTDVIENTKGNFSLEFRNYRRAHILDKSGYDIADVQIALYTSGELEEELGSLKAVTYNLENGKVVETKLDVKTSVFKDKINKNLVVKKFTLPNIKEGSIIEYEYRVRSDFMFNLQPWEFQGGYPRLWSEYNVTIPEFYYYVTLSQGYQPFIIKTQEQSRRNYYISNSQRAGGTERASFNALVTAYRWVMKDVPPLKEEAFTSTISNHIARIQFQLSELRKPFVPQKVMGTWTKVCEELIDDKDFGYSLNRDNGWLNSVMAEASGNAADDLQKAKNIFAYVRDNMSCTNYSRKYLEKTLRNVLKDRTGNEAEINLLLTTMLQKANITADPVLLSTRSHGYVYAMYPLLERFNYVIVRTIIGETTYYLDASHPRLGFGHLGSECYNGHARVIVPAATPIEFMPQSLVEKKRTILNITSNKNGGIEGAVQMMPGYFESLGIRNKIKEDGKEWLLNDIRKSGGTELTINDLKIDSLDNYDESVSVRFRFNAKPAEEDILYFNPMQFEGWKENPFKAARRYYPIEMPYAIDEAYYLNMDVPEGYEVDELPKQIIVKLNEENEGIFEYLIVETNGRISMRSRVQIARTMYMPEEYEMLREFFNLIVKKHAEQIVFKKKK